MRRLPLYSWPNVREDARLMPYTTEDVDKLVEAAQWVYDCNNEMVDAPILKKALQPFKDTNG